MQRKLMWRWALIGVVTAAAIFMMVPPVGEDPARPRPARRHPPRAPGQHRRRGARRGGRRDGAGARRAWPRRASRRPTSSACPRTTGSASPRPPPPIEKVLDKVLDDNLIDFSIARGVAITATLRPEVTRIGQGHGGPPGPRDDPQPHRPVRRLRADHPAAGDRGRPHRRAASRRRRPDPRQGADPRHGVPRDQAGGDRGARRRTRCSPPAAARCRRDSEVVPGEVEDLDGRVVGREYYLLKKASVITGRDLRNARRSQDQYNQPAVSFSLNPGRRAAVRGVHRRRTSATAWRSSSTTRCARRR